MYSIKITLLGSFVFILSSSYAQDLKSVFIDKDANGKVLSELLYNLEDDYNIDFIFNEEMIMPYTVQEVNGRIRIVDYLEYYLVLYKVLTYGDHVAVIVPKSESPGFVKEGVNLYVVSNESFIGNLVDGSNSQSVIGAQVYLNKDSNTGTLTGADGSFEVDNLSSTYNIVNVKYVGYEGLSLVIAQSKVYGQNEEIKIEIFPESKELEGVVISARKEDANFQSKITGIESMGIETLKTLPTFLGEVDPIRGITTLPGVSTTGELSSGFNVRGGEIGQNLIMQDQAIMYNPSHMFGFFSGFNPDMVSDIALYKGGGPANLGGRLSSILDVKLKNGSLDHYAISGGIGLISSRLNVEGPIGSKVSFMVGGRLSYSNWLLHANDDIQLKQSSANFNDITAKLLYNISKKDIVSLTAYRSYDDFKLASDSTFSWESQNLAINWDHNFNDRLASNFSLSYSSYLSEVNNPSPVDGFSYYNGINDVKLGYAADWEQNQDVTYKVGLEFLYNDIEPGKLETHGEQVSIEPSNMHNQYSLESAFFAQGDWSISEEFSIVAGIRYSHFSRLGKDVIYDFDYDRIESRYPTIQDSTLYDSGEKIISYHGWEPRISLRYLMNSSSSWKLSYYRSYQYLHLVSNTTATTPQDYWINSGPSLKPERGDQFSVGFFKNFDTNNYELSAEVFYKTTKNAIDYIDGADLTLNPSLEEGMARGEAKAYGLEMMIKKKSGKINGWISYTYSRSKRKFNDDSRGEQYVINNGDYYPSAYDQPHNASLVLNYRTGLRGVLSLNFNYSTGRPITIPISKFSYDGYLAVLNYSNRNEYRIPDYHRLDLSYTLKDRKYKGRKVTGEWVFSLYNLYGRKNAYSITFDQYGKATKTSILGSIFPSISYNFKI
ncbi:TonB-dependent receptor [Fulvivirga sediminis]|uniref:TonB-dependent receptor n=1 Tax=Fulvivirga sediminis TaxID=2803949 RepID=A0A937F1Y2_9BACT|nr:TonB-dependent receptor [Fulvivirga sediminis]MBL3654797.1 TonB-dependent receptor [Fulvivirga sediminis]